MSDIEGKPVREFSQQELELFYHRLQQLFDSGQLVFGVTDTSGNSYDCAVTQHLGVHKTSGLRAILMDIQVERAPR